MLCAINSKFVKAINTSCGSYERRSKVDIVFEKVVEHVDAEIKQCLNCHKTTKGSFPADMPGKLQYGNGIKAFVIHLIVCQMVSLNRVQKQVSAMIGSVISEASFLKFVLKLHQVLETWENTAIKTLLQEPSIHVDETSFRVEGKNHWIHVYSAGGTTLKLLHKKRGKEAIDDFNIIPRYWGIIIHDCWTSYLSYNHCGHGLCGSNLLRELTFIVDSNQYRWAPNMKKLLQEICRAVAEKEDKCLSDKEYANLQKRYRNILTRGGKELPTIPPRPKGKRGRLAKSDAHNLWEWFQKHETAVLFFLRGNLMYPLRTTGQKGILGWRRLSRKFQGVFGRNNMPRHTVEFQAICSLWQLKVLTPW